MFDLIDYKGKFTIIQDKGFDDEYGFDNIVGEISKEDALKESEQRNEWATYYGVPAYIGDDEDLLRVYD